jgi:iron complex transport system permease protein
MTLTGSLKPTAESRKPKAESRKPGARRPPATVGRRLTATLLVFGGLALAAILGAPLIGSTPISLARVFDRGIPFADNTDAQIFFIARLPRTLAGALVGSMLASAGVVFQGLLRNPLATPFTLGVSAGAALGAMLAITFGWSLAWLGAPAAPLASFAGSLVAVGIVYALATARHRGLSTNVLLLAGVTMNAFFSALILFVQYFADFSETFRILRWLMGDLDISSYQPLLTALPLVVLSGAVFAWLARPLNLLNLGTDAAETRGLDVLRAQRAAFLSASLATGAAVSVGGPVGFVGIIVPHLVRLLVGADHRIVLPASALFGAAFLIACDAVARTILSPLELPVGVITALIGGPFFLWLLVRRP